MKSYKELTGRYLKVNLLKNNVNIEDTATTCEIGVAPIAKTSDEEMKMREDEFTPPHTYLVIQGYDNRAFDMLPVNIKEGRIPEAPGEIAVEYWALDLIPGKPKLGDKVTLDVGIRRGKRKIISGSDKAEEVSETHIVRSGAYLESGEIFEAQGTKEYTIVGLIQPRFEQVPNYFPSAIEYLDTTSMAVDMEYTVYSTMKVIKDVQNKGEAIAEDTGLEKIETDEGYAYPIEYNNRLLSLYSESILTHFNKALQTILIFVITIIIVATIAVIYNAFNISVLERISQFGMLRSVGATPRQIKGMVIREALILSAIGIPIGLFSGVFAMKVVMYFIKKMGFELLDNLNIIVDPMVFLISSLIGLITVYLSALGPARRAANISPLEAVRNTGSYKTESFKKIKKGKLAKLLFGAEGQIAYKNLSRNKKRFNITVFSMSISIVLFIVFSSFSSFIFKATSTTFKDSADFWLYGSGGTASENLLTDKHYRELKDFKEVDRIYRTAEQSMVAIVPEDKINPKFDDATKGMWQEPYSEDDSKRVIPNSSLIKLGNENLEVLKPFLIEGKVDSDTLNKEKGVILVKNSNVYNENSKRYALLPVTKLKVGDNIDISVDYYGDDEKHTTETFKIVGIVEKGVLDFEYNLNYGIYLITSDELFAEQDNYPYNYWAITLKDGANKEPVLNYIKELSENNMGIEFWDLEAAAQESRKFAIVISIFLYGFVTVITLISSLNIINTISTNLILRTRELAMFKAVGMSQSGVKRMVALEGLFYGLTAAIYGGVAGAGLSYILYRLVIDIQEFEWHIPWEYILISSIGATLVALLSGYIPLRKMNKHIIVEDIRAID